MLASIFKVILTVAALFAVPIGSYLNGQPVLSAVAQFLAALLALFLKPPALPAKKDPDL